MKANAARLRATVGGVRILALLPVVAVFLGARWLVMSLEDAVWYAGPARARYSLALLAGAVVLACIAERSWRGRNVGVLKIGIVGVLLVAGACLPVLREQAGIVQWRYGSPHLIDIPITTMAAARAIASGSNPYTTPVDPRAESREQGKNYDGFKYMPLMAAAFAPAALAHSDRGVIVINACLHLLAAALIFLIARSLGGPAAGSFALLFYLWTRLLGRQLFGPGVTDMAAVVPLLGAFLAGEARPLVSGLLVGISVSTKIMPALAVAPLFAPLASPLRDAKAARFWIGFACGCLPALVFFAWSPIDFVDNAVLFSLFRPVDSTSWLYGHPTWWRHAATSALFLLLACLAVAAWWRRPGRRERAVLILVGIDALTLLGPVNHTNYQIWWLPWMSIVLAIGVCAYLHPAMAVTGGASAGPAVAPRYR